MIATTSRAAGVSNRRCGRADVEMSRCTRRRSRSRIISPCAGCGRAWRERPHAHPPAIGPTRPITSSSVQLVDLDAAAFHQRTRPSMLKSTIATGGVDQGAVMLVAFWHLLELRRTAPVRSSLGWRTRAQGSAGDPARPGAGRWGRRPRCSPCGAHGGRGARTASGSAVAPLPSSCERYRGGRLGRDLRASSCAQEAALDLELRLQQLFELRPAASGDAGVLVVLEPDGGGGAVAASLFTVARRPCRNRARPSGTAHLREQRIGVARLVQALESAPQQGRLQCVVDLARAVSCAASMAIAACSETATSTSISSPLGSRPRAAHGRDPEQPPVAAWRIGTKSASSGCHAPGSSLTWRFGVYTLPEVPVELPGGGRRRRRAARSAGQERLPSSSTCRTWPSSASRASFAAVDGADHEVVPLCGDGRGRRTDRS